MSEYMLGAYVWSTLVALGVVAPLAVAAVSSVAAAWRAREHAEDELPPLSSQTGPITVG